MDDDRVEVTLNAAERLIKSHLRKYIYERELQDRDYLRNLLEFERLVTEEASRDWVQVVKLWVDPQDRPTLEATIRQALMRAQTTAGISLPGRDVSPRVAEFARDFDLRAFIADVS